MKQVSTSLIFCSFISALSLVIIKETMFFHEGKSFQSLKISLQFLMHSLATTLTQIKYKVYLVILFTETGNVLNIDLFLDWQWECYILVLILNNIWPDNLCFLIFLFTFYFIPKLYRILNLYFFSFNIFILNFIFLV